jgi:ligand-binding SRPBCC domain-containing protein
MPPWRHARIERAVIIPPPSSNLPRLGTAPPRRFAPVAAGTGTRLTLSFRPFPHSPFRLSWEAEIAQFSWNKYFLDRQRRGPFSFWEHTHVLEPEARPDASGVLIDGTLLRDHVIYELPLGPVGNLAQKLFVARELDQTFAYRRQRTAELLPEIASIEAKVASVARQLRRA